MARPKLSYFDFPGGRGEDCRLALFIAGVDFEDDRIKGPTWPEKKSETPFGALPVLEIEGKGTLSQSNVILSYLGREYGLLPSDAFAAAHHESILGAVEDMRHQAFVAMKVEGDEARKAAREDLAANYLQTWAANIEKQIGDGPFFAGDRISVVDIKLFTAINWFQKGGVDHVPTTVFSDFPKLQRLHGAVAAHEKVVAWYSR